MATAKTSTAASDSAVRRLTRLGLGIRACMTRMGSQIVPLIIRLVEPAARLSGALAGDPSVAGKWAGRADRGTGRVLAPIVPAVIGRTARFADRGRIGTVRALMNSTL
jgi:hypothetical protein